MPTSILVAFANNDGVARRARLTVEESNKEDEFRRLYEGQTAEAFIQGLWRARGRAWQVLGKPTFLNHLAWNLLKLRADDLDPGNLDGGSLYGACAMVLLQEFSRSQSIRESALRSQFRMLLPALRGTCLSTVAVSAEGDEATGDFRPVGGIRQKLQGLSQLREDELQVCVVAWEQEIPPDVFQHENHVAQRCVQILRAHDPMDAFGRLFDLQAHGVLRRTF